MRVDVISLEEIEDIAYKSAYLVARGWKRMYGHEEPSVENVIEWRHRKDYYDRFETPKYVWVKEGVTREYDVGCTCSFFELNDAYWHEVDA